MHALSLRVQTQPATCVCRYLRDEPAEHGLIRLSSYLRAWGWAYLVFTLLLLFKRERRHKASGEVLPACPPLQRHITMI